MTQLTIFEICAGAGGQSLGFELAGFLQVAAIDIDGDSCETLRMNRPEWTVIHGDVFEFDGHPYSGIDLLAGGVPCPPFSIAGKQLGNQDERDLFPEALRLTKEMRPRALLLENVRGFAMPRFASYRRTIATELAELGYAVHWTVLNAVDFGVPQYRPRFVLVALRYQDSGHFAWPSPGLRGHSVGESITDLMGERSWPGVMGWSLRAGSPAPTIVGGSKKHGGPDLGPTRAREEWRKLGVNGKSIAELAPEPEFPVDGLPRLTVRMVARLQGFPDSWQFAGRKTSAYKQVGNAFPSPVAMAIGLSIQTALSQGTVEAPQLQLAPQTSHSK